MYDVYWSTWYWSHDVPKAVLIWSWLSVVRWCSTYTIQCKTVPISNGTWFLCACSVISVHVTWQLWICGRSYMCLFSSFTTTEATVPRGLHRLSCFSTSMSSHYREFDEVASGQYGGRGGSGQYISTYIQCMCTTCSSRKWCRHLPGHLSTCTTRMCNIDSCG